MEDIDQLEFIIDIIIYRQQSWNRAGLENGLCRACASIGVEQKGSELNSFSVLVGVKEFQKH